MMVHSNDNYICHALHWIGVANCRIFDSGFMVGPTNIAVVGSNKGVSKFLLEGQTPDGIVYGICRTDSSECDIYPTCFGGE